MNAAWFLVLALSNFTADGLTPRAGVLPGAPEEIVERAFVPNGRNAHGEVRLVHRDGALCVQTILCSPELVRSLQAMERKERANWPDGADHHADSQGFLERLSLATDRALEDFAARSDGADARRKLLIELILDDDAAWYAFYIPEIDTSAGRLDVRNPRRLFLRQASPAYIARAMRLQLESAFHLNATDLDKLLAPPD